MRKILAISLGLLSSITYAQNNPQIWCGMDEKTQEYMSNHPNEIPQITQNREQLEEFTRDFANNSNRTTGNNYIIPVVFHILHQNGPENISDQKVYEQLEMLNRDYNGYNADTADVADAFRPIVGTSNFQFVLAKKDPNGNPTTGIVRYNTPDTEDPSSSQAASGRIWPSNMYMNFFVVKCLDASSCGNVNAGGVAAYTYRPGTVPSSIDAVYARYVYVGGNERTLTHEIGHWFNLSHTWGQTNDPDLSSNCNDDDFVDDTPNTEGRLGGCDQEQITCGTLDNVDNHMDYTSCSRMFTEGQVERMQAAMESSVSGRNNLWTESNLIATGIIDCYKADFITTNDYLCSSGDIQFFDQSILFGKNSWTWSFPGGTPANTTNTNPVVHYSSPGLYDVVLTVSNGTTNLTTTQTKRIMVSEPLGNYPPYYESFENYTDLPNDKWLVLNENQDEYTFELSTTAAYTGSNSAKMGNFNNDKYKIDELISSSIDLSPLSSIDFSFKTSYAQNPNTASGDNLYLYVSKDCGANWLLRLTKSGSSLASATSTSSDFTPSSTSDWAEQNVFGIPSSYLTENFMFKFVFESDSGNNLYIDDININGSWKSKPQLFLPEDLTTGVPENVTIDWKSINAVDSYEWELDTSNQFNSSLYQTGTTTFISTDPNGTDTEFQTSDLLWSQKYYWRVRSVTGGISSSWSDTWSFTVAADGVGLNELNEDTESFRIYPNPAGSSFVVKNNKLGSNIKVYNLLGEVVYSANIKNELHTVDSNNWNKGIYIVSINGINQKVVIQ